MDYQETIRRLKEQRDFYAAAVVALEAIHAHENPAVPKARTRAKKRRHVTSLDVSAEDITRTLSMKASAAAKELGVTTQQLYNLRSRAKQRKPTNGSAGDPVSMP